MTVSGPDLTLYSGCLFRAKTEGKRHDRASRLPAANRDHRGNARVVPAEAYRFVLEALEQKEPEKARTAMKDHVDIYAAQIKEKFL